MKKNMRKSTPPSNERLLSFAFLFGPHLADDDSTLPLSLLYHISIPSIALAPSDNQNIVNFSWFEWIVLNCYQEDIERTKRNKSYCYKFYRSIKRSEEAQQDFVYIYIAEPLERCISVKRIYRRPKVNLGIGMDVGGANTGGIERSGMEIIDWLAGGSGNVVDVLFCS